MAKIEVALLVGAESKEWLAGFERLVTRLEKLQPKLATAKNVAQAEEDFDNEEDSTEEDDDFGPAKKAAKKANSFDEDEGESEEAEEVEAASEDDEDEEEKPKKKKKISLEDVNDACKAKMKALGGGKAAREKVLNVLKKKFKTESISDLKAEQYAAVISAMS